MRASGRMVDVSLNMSRFVVFASAIACASLCSGPSQANSTLHASHVRKIVFELSQGDRSALVQAKVIVPDLFKTRADQVGFFAAGLASDNSKGDYVSLRDTRRLEYSLQRYAVMSAQNRDWRSFAVSVQLDMDILDKLARLKPVGDMKVNGGIVRSAAELSLIPVFGIEAGIDSEDRYVVRSVLRQQPNTSACLSALAKRLKAMNRMAASHMDKINKMLYKGKAYHFGDKVDYRDSGLAKFNAAFQKSFHTKLETLRPMLAQAVKCLESEKAKSTAHAH